MSTQSIQAVLFDVGGIFVTQRLEAQGFIKALGLNPNDPFDVDCVDKAIWSHRDQHDLGLSDQEFWGLVALDVGVDVPRSQQLDTLIKADVQRMHCAEEAPLAVCDQLLQNGVKLGLLANAPKSVGQEIPRTEWASQRFSHFIFSSSYGVCKPSSSLYQTAANELQLLPEEILFIDDRSKHVRGAQYVGMDAFVWESAEQAVVELRRRNLL